MSRYKSDSILKNHIFNVVIQIINIIFPLISIPYLTRIFGPNILGKINFANSVVQYFVMIASVGIPLYSIREISKRRENIYEVRKFMKEIVFLQVSFTIISFVMFLVCITKIELFKNDIVIYLLLSLQIISNCFNFNWFIQGIEKYKYIAITNFFSKFINLALILILVKSKQNYYEYAFIIGFCSLFTVIINMIVCIYLLKEFEYKDKIIIKFNNVKKHLYPIIIFFLSNIAINIYTSMDQIMLGFMSGEESVGYYSISMRIVKIILSFVTSISVLMIPRISNSIENNRIDDVEYYINLSINLVYIISIPCVFFIFAVGKELLLVFLGKEFIKSIFVFKIISILLIVIGLSNIFGMQVMIPYGMEKKFTIIITIAAIINLILNLILIPKLSYLGTSISTLIAECIVTYLMYKEVKEKITNKSYAKIPYKMLISSIIFYMFIKCFIVPNFSSNIEILIISAPIAVLIYFISLIILKEKFLLYILNSIKSTFFSR